LSLSAAKLQIIIQITFSLTILLPLLHPIDHAGGLPLAYELVFGAAQKVDDFDVATFDLLIDRLERCLRTCGVVFLRHQSAPAVLLLVLFAIGISTAD